MGNLYFEPNGQLDLGKRTWRLVQAWYLNFIKMIYLLLKSMYFAITARREMARIYAGCHAPAAPAISTLPSLFADLEDGQRQTSFSHKAIRRDGLPNHAGCLH